MYIYIHVCVCVYIDIRKRERARIPPTHPCYVPGAEPRAVAQVRQRARGARRRTGGHDATCGYPGSSAPVASRPGAAAEATCGCCDGAG